MPDDVTYAQHHNLAKMNARATIAAALIASKVVDFSGTFFNDVSAAQNPSVGKLKSAVDTIMQAVVQAL